MQLLFPYDAVVFDLDGTLFEAADGIISSTRYAMNALGLPIPPEADLNEVIGPPLLASFRDLLKVPDALLPQALALYRSDFPARGMYLYSVYPGIRPLLETLKQNGVFVSMATSKPQGLAEKILKHFRLDHLFDRIIGESDDDNAKLGKPELIRRSLPERYRRAAMVGDRRFDMEGAQAAGIEGIGAGYGYGTAEELQKAGATCIASTTEELFALLCPNAKPARGFFLTVEGPDGSGKTTQINRLEESLRRYGFDVLRTREPGGCAISEKIRQIILDTANSEMCDECEALLYAASRAQHVRQVIRPAVEKGMLVLSDRFEDSSVAYQGGGRNLGIDTVLQINAPAVGEMRPDATLYLAIDHRVALSRRLNASIPDRLESEALSFHARVQQSYEELIHREPERFLVVDVAQDADSVARDALEKVLDRLTAC